MYQQTLWEWEENVGRGSQVCWMSFIMMRNGKCTWQSLPLGAGTQRSTRLMAVEVSNEGSVQDKTRRNPQTLLRPRTLPIHKVLHTPAVRLVKHIIDGSSFHAIAATSVLNSIASNGIKNSVQFRCKKFERGTISDLCSYSAVTHKPAVSISGETAKNTLFSSGKKRRV